MIGIASLDLWDVKRGKKRNISPQFIFRDSEQKSYPVLECKAKILFKFLISDSKIKRCWVAHPGITNIRVLSTGGGRESPLPNVSASPPQKKKFSWKKIWSYFKWRSFLTKILRNQWRLLMSRNVISANPEHHIFKIFRVSMPLDPLRRPKKSFLATSWLKHFFQDRLPPPPPPQQKILDRTLNYQGRS